MDFTLSGSFFFFREFVTFLVNKFILYPSVDFIFHNYSILNPHKFFFFFFFPSKDLFIVIFVRRECVDS